MPSYMRIFAIAIPIMLSNAMLPLIGLVDTAVIGRMGQIAPVGAVGLGGQVIAMLFWLFNFFAISTTAFVGRALAKGDQEAVIVYLRSALILALYLSIAFVALIPLWLLAAPDVFGASQEVRPFLNDYLHIRLLGFPLALIGHIGTGYFLAHEATRKILWVELSMQLTNLILDVLFVLGFGWGVSGVAWASVLAEALGAALILWMMRPVLTVVFRKWVWRLGQGAAHLLRHNGFLFMRSLGLNLMILIFFRVSASLGDADLAVNSILMLFVTFAAQATDGFAQAIEVLVARAIGAGNLTLLRGAIFRGSVISLLLALIWIVIILLFGRDMFNWIASNAELRAMAPDYLGWVMLAVLIGVFAWTLDGVFFGAALSREMMISMVYSLVVYFVMLLVFVPLLGNHGLWLGFALGYGCRTIGLAYFYPRVEKLAREHVNGSTLAQPNGIDPTHRADQ